MINRRKRRLQRIFSLLPLCRRQLLTEVRGHLCQPVHRVNQAQRVNFDRRRVTLLVARVALLVPVTFYGARRRLTPRGGLFHDLSLRAREPRRRRLARRQQLERGRELVALHGLEVFQKGVDGRADPAVNFDGEFRCFGADRLVGVAEKLAEDLDDRLDVDGGGAKGFERGEDDVDAGGDEFGELVVRVGQQLILMIRLADWIQMLMFNAYDDGLGAVDFHCG